MIEKIEIYSFKGKGSTYLKIKDDIDLVEGHHSSIYENGLYQLLADIVDKVNEVVEKTNKLNPTTKKGKE